jgi:hypothetical protein
VDAAVVIDSIKTTRTRNGNTGRTVTDADRTEYTTFRAAIGESAERVEGHRRTSPFTRSNATESQRLSRAPPFIDSVERADVFSATVAGTPSVPSVSSTSLSLFGEISFSAT